MKIVHTYINNMYLDKFDEIKECFADKWGLVSLAKSGHDVTLTNLCVRSLAQDAYDRDFKIKIIKDCCRAFDEETHNFTIKDLKATREEIEFLNLNEFVK